MKILFIGWNSVGRRDLEAAFIAEGHSLIMPPFSLDGKTYNDLPDMENQLSAILHKEVPDLVFSVNYYPVISIFCYRNHIRYISWIYDSPFRRLYSSTVVNPCNIIYVFDRELYLEFHNAGISTVRYMPMAANTERLDAISSALPDPLPFIYDVSFVGSLYLEKINPFRQDALFSDYTKGYLTALAAAQMKIQGYNFIQEVIAPVLDDLSKAYPMGWEPGTLESKEHYYAQFVVNRRITAAERIELLDAVAHNHTVDFFTHYKEFTLPNLRNHGPVDYYQEMPLVFKQSRINLNITLRGMKSAIPLRAMDIMGSGGFLLSNFQADFLDYFVPDEDFVCYESREDLIQKVDYYLIHEEERRAIARNGHDKVAAGHTYRHRIREILDF